MFPDQLFFRITQGLEESSISKGEITFAIRHANQFRAVFDRFVQVALHFSGAAQCGVLPAGDDSFAVSESDRVGKRC